MATRSVNIRELIRKSRLESRIEDRLAQHPYLISPELKSPTRQLYVSKNSRLDLLFETKKDTVIVEIKRGKITVSAINQIIRYKQEIKIKDTAFRGYLVGRGINPDAEAKLKKLSLKLHYLGIGKEISEQIVICWKCRKARAHTLETCPYDGENRVI